MAVDVLDDHDRIVDEHPEHEDQAEEHDHVERVAHQLNADEGDQHREWDGDGDEDRVPETEKCHEDGDNEDQPRENVVLELVHHLADLLGLVAENGDDRALGQRSLLARELRFHGIRDGDEVRPGALLDGERN